MTPPFYYAFSLFCTHILDNFCIPNSILLLIIQTHITKGAPNKSKLEREIYVYIKIVQSIKVDVFSLKVSSDTSIFVDQTFSYI